MQLRDAFHEADPVLDMTTKVTGIPMNPLNRVVLPVQRTMMHMCHGVRVIKSIVTWEECHIAFWITNSAILLAIPVLFVPWGMVTRFVLRVMVWTLLGPWMKLVDIFYVQRLDREKKLDAWSLEHSTAVEAAKRAHQTRKENVIKLKSWRDYLFGKYMVQVPRFKEFRYKDVPLSVSTATPYDPNLRSPPRVVKRNFTQDVTGEMVPTWGNGSDECFYESKARSSVIPGSTSDDDNDDDKAGDDDEYYDALIN